MDYKETKISSETVFSGRLLTIHLDKVALPNGNTSTREVVLHPGAVCVLPIKDDYTIYMTKQFRYSLGREVIELPAGKIDPGEDPFETAKRELKEETGLTANKYTYWGEFYSSAGFSNEILHLYLAQDLTDSGSQNLDEDEFLDVFTMPLEEAYQMVLEGKLPDSKTQAMVTRAYNQFVGNK